jgi:hypothetical protein
LVIEEVGRVPAVDQGVFWEELKKILPTPKPPAKPSVDLMTDLQARAFGQALMPFGQFQGQPVDEVPLNYLRKLCDPSAFIRNLKRYLATDRVQAEDNSEP